MPKKSQTREEMERAVGKLQEERLKMDMEFSKLYGREEPTYLPQQKSSRRLTCDEMETAMRSMQIERQRQDEENRRLVAERQRLIREQQRLEQDSHQSREYFSSVQSSLKF